MNEKIYVYTSIQIIHILYAPPPLNLYTVAVDWRYNMGHWSSARTRTVMSISQYKPRLGGFTFTSRDFCT